MTLPELFCSPPLQGTPGRLVPVVVASVMMFITSTVVGWFRKCFLGSHCRVFFFLAYFLLVRGGNHRCSMLWGHLMTVSRNFWATVATTFILGMLLTVSRPGMTTYAIEQRCVTQTASDPLWFLLITCSSVGRVMHQVYRQASIPCSGSTPSLSSILHQFLLSTPPSCWPSSCLAWWY